VILIDEKNDEPYKKSWPKNHINHKNLKERRSTYPTLYLPDAVGVAVSVYLDTVSDILCNVLQAFEDHVHIWRKYVAVLFVCG